ncbi:MAG TPA: PAS domain-containing protein [Pyrinomonadaceae bacterium]|nr:PAS domain-containing protein [Pyrinomonadaceae bacterium]
MADQNSDSRELRAETAGRQKADWRLHESERFLEILIGNLPGVVYRCRCDAEWTSEYLSVGCLNLTGYTPADFVETRRITWGQIIHPEDRNLVRLGAQQFVLENTPFHTTYRIITATGAVKYVLDYSRPVSDASGVEAAALEGFITDITERVRADELLGESEARYRLLAEHMRDLVCQHQIDGRFVYLSSSCEATLGFRPDELVGTNPYELFHPEDVARIRTQTHARLLAGENHLLSEYRMRHKSSGYVWIEAMWQTITDERGAVVQLQTCSRDISHRKEMEAERTELLAREQAARQDAEKANAAKDDFLALVSHELRTPLTTIKTLMRVLKEGDETEAERHEFLDTISIECDRQIDMVLNLLDVARIEDGTFEFARERVDVREVLRSCCKFEGSAAEGRKQDFKTEVPPDLPDVRGDMKALRRAICAIIENAIKYTPDGGSITLSAREVTQTKSAPPEHEGEAGDASVVYSSSEDVKETTVDTAGGEAIRHIAISVTDTGRGIRPEDLPHIFEKFYRGKSTVPRDETTDGTPDDAPGGDSTPGVGLGLYLALRIAEGHGGRIEVESEPLRGSCFTVYLPVMSERQAEQFEHGSGIDDEDESHEKSKAEEAG